VDWSPQQEKALRLVERWRASGASPYFVLGGYAGTGKSTLARHLASGAPGQVFFASYTGKAAHVLRRMGVNATTIHKLVYLPRDRCDERLRRLEAELAELRASPVSSETRVRKIETEIRKEKQNLRRPEFTLNYDSPLASASLVVVDEYSMVDERVGRDLLSFGCPVLALGDPGQLPPVRGSCFFSKPDYVLTEVHRQALENPIIAMSMLVRQGADLKPGDYGPSRVVPRSKVPDDAFDRMLADSEQVLVGRNSTRRRVNQRVRRVLGMPGDMPLPGDKLVCLRNSHEEGLYNGQTWRVVRSSGREVLRLTVEDDDGARLTCLAHPDHFRGAGDDLDPARRREANEFDYGYALTVHKSQGSQWDSVTILDEWSWQDREKWLYTAVTRAAERVTVIC